MTVNQTFLSLLWDAVSVQSCKVFLALDEMILKNESGQIVDLQPCQQIVCTYLFAKGLSERG